MEAQQQNQKIYSKYTTMNARALAVRANPQSFKRGRGVLHWETGVDAAEANRVTHQGDEEQLKAYQAEHRDRLVSQAADIRRQAKAALRGQAGDFPVTTADWLKWLGDTRDTWNALLRESSASRQAAISARVTPMETLQDIARLGPGRPRAPKWTRKLVFDKKGPFYAVQTTPGHYLYVFAACIGQACWAFLLRRNHGGGDDEFLG